MKFSTESDKIGIKFMLTISNLRVSQTYHNFKINNVVEIPELQCTLHELVHIPTNAQVMHIANDDPENLFCLSFQTLPHKSDGVAHILEHTVLCGSRKYPVKDPFFAMTRRSLHTFMNALTGSDFTCYPAATQVPKDFYNLLEVYLDAVFHPNLKKLSFLQEGHRLEFSQPADPTSPLERKGIVFNEMKGAMTSSSSRLWETIHAGLFPDITYGINSGGNPAIIPQLTFEELHNFYNTFYHPSRCLFFFYGNMPLEGHLDFIEKNALSGVSKAAPLPAIPLQPRFTEPRYIVEAYPISQEEDAQDKTMLGFGWLTCHIQEQEELLALSILEMILMDTDASPLKLALLKSGLCKLASSSLDTEISECPWIITLKGCNKENAEACEKLIFLTLRQIADQGIPSRLMETAFHQLEFHRSEITGDHVPFGLSLFMRSALLKQHGVNPIEGLKIHTLFDEVRRNIRENPSYFGSLIYKHLINNPHFVRVVMVPDKELNAKEQQSEQLELCKTRELMNDNDDRLLIQQAKDLSTFQKMQEEEDLDILPKVSLEDVPKNAHDFALAEEKIGNLTVFHHGTFTNQIIYTDLILPLPHLKDEELFFVKLFIDLAPQMGTGGRSYAENLEYIQAYTGGIGINLNLNRQAHDHAEIHPALHIHGKALHRNAEKLFILLREFLTFVNFSDKNRLSELIHKHYTGLEAGINQNALKYAINLSASGLDPSSYLANAWHGLDYFWKLKNLAQNLPREIDILIANLEILHDKLFGFHQPELVITCTPTMYETLKKHRFYGLADMEIKAYHPWQTHFSIPSVFSQGRVIASPVAFLARVFKTVPYTDIDSPALSVAAALLDNLSLHGLLREQGGAYGGGAVNNTISGNFYFYSYRDPNITSSLEAFDVSVQDLITKPIDPSDLEEAKLEIIQGLDEPTAPGSRGDCAYGWLKEGKSLEVRQNYRNRLLSLTSSDVVKAVKKYIVPKISQSAVVVFAGRELLDKENVRMLTKGQPPLPLEVV